MPAAPEPSSCNSARRPQVRAASTLAAESSMNRMSAGAHPTAAMAAAKNAGCGLRAPMWQE
jgi:hypothetical protein